MHPVGLPRHAAEPEAVITEVVCALEPALTAEMVHAVLVDTLKRAPHRRALAAILVDDPAWLTSGRAESPAFLERLTRALRRHGAELVQVPRCGMCGGHGRLVGFGPDGRARICERCQSKLRRRANPCAVCGRYDIAFRDRERRPRCASHPPEGGADPMVELCGLIRGVCPELTLDVIADVVRSIEPVRNRQRRLLWALLDHAGLLTGEGAKGPPKTVALIKALKERGAGRLVVPACPLCGRTVALTKVRDGVRCCEGCRAVLRAEACTRCGRSRPVMARTLDGQPLCGSCRVHSPLGHRVCSRCGQRRPARARIDGEAVCDRCYRPPTEICSVCGEQHPCHYAGTDTPTCGACRHKNRPREACAGCGRDNFVSYRTPDGRAMCTVCGAKKRLCAVCGNTVRIFARTPEGEGVCQTCWRKHPASRRPCRNCGTVARLRYRGMCAPCAVRDRLHDILSIDGHVRPEVEPVFQALVRRDPTAMLWWLDRRPVRVTVLRALAAGRGPVTHHTLDRLAPVNIVQNLRMILVAGAVLPARDEQLAALERRLPADLTRVQDPEGRRLLHAFITWHLLRRLRDRSRHRPLTEAQIHGARSQVRQAVHLLNWLTAQDTTPGACTQDQVDAWLDGGPAHRADVYTFLTWTGRNHHTRHLTVPLRAPSITGEIIAQDTRWALVHRLLHDNAIAVTDRMAGLLILLFAQPPSRITSLTTEHVTLDRDTVTLRLGPVPARMPPPLDAYLRHLYHQANRPETPPQARWLFPGRFPGQRLSCSQLGRRLHDLGIRPRVSRSTALVELTGELPAVVFSRLLGVSQTTADTWRRIAAGEHASYAAHLVRR
ncbi:hypothetical protein OG824_28015 [Streptomyces prunicolor]|uniref:hypothetical protein n=1 Tax=Streptomyces prunicolor TaxID=67348 RepID=UPI00224E2A98|nr:hypothetical protein [Streptomyces prunicolor]MCX5239050.1 hypothetical protein [Streptomyces prunicolor]